MTDDEIRAAYRVLVKVWHPDRFEGDSSLKKVAEEKLKSINSAFQLVASPSHKSGRRKQPAPAPQESSRKTQPTSRQPPPVGGRGYANQAKGRTSPIPPGPTNAPPDTGRSIPTVAPRRRPDPRGFVLYAALFAIAVLFRVYSKSDKPADTLLKTTYHPAVVEYSKAALDAANADVSKTPRPSVDRARSDRARKDAEVAQGDAPHANSEPNRPKVVSDIQGRAQTPSVDTTGLFTVDSTKDEVLAIQGTPTAFSNNTFEYGYSEVYFRDGRVVSWKNVPSLNPLHVKLAPTGSVGSSLNYFTVDSTKDEVLAIQGTPTAFSSNTFEYGYSEVYFRDGRVVSWKNVPSLNPLHVKLAPTGSAGTSLDYFTVDSTKDEVLAIQGTPTAFSSNTFEYGYSEVYFRDGRVVSWKNVPSLNPLRVKLR